MKKKNSRKIRKLATQSMNKKNHNQHTEKGSKPSKGEQKIKINLPFEEAMKIAIKPVKKPKSK
jgi:hypothetical protein